MKGKKITIQNTYKGLLDDNSVASFDVQTDFVPTDRLLHKNSRFLFIISGKAKIRIQDKVHEMHQGVIIALLPWQISEIIEIEGHISYYLLIYNFNFIDRVLKRDLNINNENFDMVEMLYHNNSVLVPQSDFQKIKRLFEDIRDEIGIRSIDIDVNHRKYQSIYILSRITELLIYYLRYIENNGNDFSEKIISEEIFKYMYLNSSSDLSLRKLSKIFLMSETSICKYINNLTGLGFFELLTEMRLSKAQFLLLHTNLTLEEIAPILRFSDSSQLSKAFNKSYGIGTKKFKTANLSNEVLSGIRLDERSHKIIDYICDNYEDDIDIVDVGKLFKISPRDINKILKYYVENNFNSFLNLIRLQKAAMLLINTKDSIANISVSVGFNSIKTFNRNFYNNYKMTPSEFRTTTKEQVE